MATRRFALVTAALAALLAAGMVAPAAAEDAASVTEETRQEWREHMAGLGISSAVRNVLVEKLERGVLPDSMIDGVDPVSSKTYREGGFDVTKKTFQDGSVSLTAVEVAQIAKRDDGRKDPTALGTSISGCVTNTSGTVTYYRDCLVRYTGIIWHDSFRADYAVANRNTAQVLGVRSWSITIIGGSYSEVDLSIVRQRQTSTLPAVARLAYNLQVVGGTPIQTRAWTELRLRGTTRSVVAG
ncbi:hypothetical protein [Cellulomonas fimi]|uniref:Lipoprotein n=1 Tax=Cellulomonas fimi TaxID=1708 RepID=A0A7Y0QG22_CELFI|nr:hypothetical protein [Cellulomonas fimi]NMR18795.1 hypothetical protein [Cellulomonas fimi]